MFAVLAEINSIITDTSLMTRTMLNTALLRASQRCSADALRRGFVALCEAALFHHRAMSTLLKNDATLTRSLVRKAQQTH
jgi:hypothetical protein